MASAGETDTSGYSLATADKKPIPRDVFFALWNEAALRGCAGNEPFGIPGLSSSECREKIRNNAPVCASKLSASVPLRIDSTSTARSFGKSYMRCIVPGVYCNGVEVKTEAEARRYCVDSTSLNEICERRLESRANLSHEQGKKFCACFIEKSQAKYSNEKILSEMESGSSSAFKETLKDEFALCKAQIR